MRSDHSRSPRSDHFSPLIWQISPSNQVRQEQIKSNQFKQEQKSPEADRINLKSHERETLFATSKKGFQTYADFAVFSQVVVEPMNNVFFSAVIFVYFLSEVGLSLFPISFKRSFSVTPSLPPSSWARRAVSVCLFPSSGN